LMIFLALAFLFFTILLSLIVLNKNVDSEVEQDATTDEKEQTENQTNNETEKETNHSNDDQDTNDSSDEEDKKSENNDAENNDSENNEEESNESVKEVEQEEIEDSNVKKAFVGEWSPVGTTQEGAHTTNYYNGSQDRKEIKEIKEAVIKVTKVDEDNMVEWRVENGGDQKVIATISDDNETEFYRVYLSWIDNEGWQVNKFEELKKNDKK